jgi:hemerythrin-like domain-containing protein
MNATEFLMEEHRLIERALFALERATNRLSRGEDVYLRFFAGTTYFISGFAERCHHTKEEEVLFPAMVSTGLPRETGPVAMMLADHAESRRLTQMMRQMIERYQGGDLQAKDQVVRSALGYVRLLRQHIYKEDNILYPMADSVIPNDQLQQIHEAITRAEYTEDGEEIHEKYRGLVERLEKECVRSG